MNLLKIISSREKNGLIAESYSEIMNPYKRRPNWLKIKLPAGSNFSSVNQIIKKNNLNTVCQSARCPNIGECWGQKTATFMILGDICTRNCRFCAVQTGTPKKTIKDESLKISGAVKELNLRYVVVTSVTRDDLNDGGASQFAATIKAIKDANPDCRIEVLIPDFQGSEKSLRIVLDAKPDILNHNIETVRALYEQVRARANYQRSLTLLFRAKEFGAATKTGLMLGIGETKEQLIVTMQDILSVGCRMLTIGQYLAPSRNHYPIQRFVEPKEFSELKEIGLRMGFEHIESGPLVRSSYHAEKQYARG